MNPKVSVITCTARYGGIDIAWAGLKRQTLSSFEWIIMDEVKRTREVHEFCADTRVRHFMSPRKKTGMFWNLDQSFNEALRQARGELIVTLQDYVYLLPNSIERLVSKYNQLTEHTDEIVISGVGHKYILDRPITNPKGKVSVYGAPVTELSHGDIDIYEKDPRIKKRGLHVCNPIEWEANYGLFSKNLAYQIGGFDEDFDAGWGYDNVNFAERAQAAGAWIWLDENNEIISISHENIFKEADIKDEAPNNEELWARKLGYIKEGVWRTPWLR